MADSVVRVIAKFTDKEGTATRSSFLLKRTLAEAGSLEKSAINSDAKAIVDALEGASRLKFESATMYVSLSITGSGFKEDPLPGSSVAKQGWIEFFGALGDSLKRSKTRIWIPSPKDDVLAGNNTRFDTTNADVALLIDRVREMVKTIGGTDVSQVGSSNVRIRRTRK